jgi:predicted Rdx family selenoprotein
MGARNQIPLDAYYVSSNLALQPDIEIQYCRIAQYGDMANFACNAAKIIYPYANIKEDTKCCLLNLLIYVNGVLVWNMRKEGRFHENNVVEFLIRIRKIVEGY